MNNADMGGGRFGDVVTDPGWGFRLMTMITLTTGTAFIMWLGEQTTERGIGNGISLIIFAGIVSGIPTRRRAATGGQRAGEIQPLTDRDAARACSLVSIAIVVFFERAQRRIPIQYARRQVGRRVYGGQTRAPAAQGEHGEHDPADLRLERADVPGDAGELQHPGHADASARSSTAATGCSTRSSRR